VEILLQVPPLLDLSVDDACLCLADDVDLRERNGVEPGVLEREAAGAYRGCTSRRCAPFAHRR
jgi:hypothetical protein